MPNVFDQFDTKTAAPQQGNAFDQFSPQTAYTASVLPLSKDTQGNIHLAIPGMVQNVINSLTLPGDVYQGKASDTDVGRVLGLAAIASPMSAASRAGERMIPGVSKNLQRGKVPIPTTKELQQSGVAQIQAAKTSPLEVAPGAVSNWSRDFQQQLIRPVEGSAIHPTRMPATNAILQELQNAPANGKFTPLDYQALRQTFQSIAQDFNASNADQVAASRAIKSLDNFLGSVGPRDVVAGPASAAPATQQQLLSRGFAGQREAQRIQGLFGTGNANYASAMRSNALTGDLNAARTGIVERAVGRSQATNSGKNLDSQLRSRVESLLEKPKEVSGLSDNEISALENFIKGNRARNWSRSVGNLFGGGGGYGRLAASGYGGGFGAAAGTAMGGPVGGAVGGAIGMLGTPTVGWALKNLENSMSKKELGAIASMMRKRSPLYASRAANAPIITPGLGGQAAFERALAQMLLKPSQPDTFAPSNYGTGWL